MFCFSLLGIKLYCEVDIVFFFFLVPYLVTWLNLNTYLDPESIFVILMMKLIKYTAWIVSQN